MTGCSTRREGLLQRDCIDWVRREHGDRLLVKNNHGDEWSPRGFPDLQVMGGPKTVYVELKRPHGTYGLQGAQKVWRRRMEARGVPVYVVDDLEDFKEIIRKEFDLHA